MKLIFAIVGLLCIAQVYGNVIREEGGEDLPEIDDSVLDCIQRELEGIEVSDVDLQGSLTSLLETFRSLRSRYDYCQSLAQSVPPTRFEEIARDACMLAWRANVAAELLRIRNNVSESTGNAREFWELVLGAYETCMGIETEPEPESVKY